MQKNKTMDLSRILAALKERWYIYLCTTVLCTAVAAYVCYYRVTPTYTASTTIFVSNDNENATETTINNITIAEKMAKDCQIIATSRRVFSQVRKTLPNAVLRASKVSVSLLSNSRTLRLSVTDEDPEMAASIANALTDALVIEAKDITKVENIRPVDRASIPTAPNTSQHKRTLILSAFLGAVLGIAAVLLIEAFDKRIHSASDVSELFGLPVLASIPKITEKDIEEKGEKA